MMTTRLLIASLLIGCGTLQAEDYYVAKDGHDGNAGTSEQPFATIGKGALALKPGDTLFIRQGEYRESVTLARGGKADKPISIQAHGLDDVEISGLEPLTSPWTLHDPAKGIYVADLSPQMLSGSIPDSHFQIFVSRQPLLAARWPNCRYDEVLSRKGWHPGGKDARYGHFNVPELQGSELDLAGVDIYLNVIHQFCTWKRKVTAFDRETGRIEYPQDIPLGPHFLKKGSYWVRSGWKDDYFYLEGDYGLLDYPGEFHCDLKAGKLFIVPPHGEDPNEASIEIKTRLYGLQGKDLAHVNLKGISLFGCAFSFDACNDMSITGCTLQYPVSDQEVAELGGKKTGPKVRTMLNGHRNVIEDVYIAHSTTTGLSMSGKSNRLENSIVHDSCYSGSLSDKCVSAWGPSVIRQCTFFNSGNVGVHFGGPGALFELNHVHNNGLISHDVSAVYTSGDRAMKCRITHNWVHDNPSPVGSIGIRGDDLTRGLTVDHNVVWNTKAGIVVKGDKNSVFNNTVFNASSYDILLPNRAEPRKKRQVDAGKTFLDVQNANSLYYNNLVNDETSAKHKSPLPPIAVGDKGGGHVYASEPPLVNPNACDFRPLEAHRKQLLGKPLPKDGITTVELDESSQPYVGAYGFGGPYWKPGAIHGMKYQLLASGAKHVLRLKYTLPLLRDDTLTVSVNGQPVASQAVTRDGSFRSFMVPVVLKTGSSRVTIESDLFGSIAADIAVEETGNVYQQRFPESGAGSVPVR
jgi:hypothetical protein